MVLPNYMTAAVLTGHGGLEKLIVRANIPVPKPKANEVLINVGACGMNNTDINTRIGWYSKSVGSGTTTNGGADGLDRLSEDDATWGGGAIIFPRIQGADVAGRIVAVGDGVSKERMGERVIVDPWLRDRSDPKNRNLAGYLGSERDGGFAQYTAVPEENAFLINSELSDAELATFPCSYSTGEHMLSRIRLGEGVRRRKPDRLEGCRRLHGGHWQGRRHRHQGPVRRLPAPHRVGLADNALRRRPGPGQQWRVPHGPLRDTGP